MVRRPQNFVWRAAKRLYRARPTNSTITLRAALVMVTLQ
jgi:hypothetical protein